MNYDDEKFKYKLATYTIKFIDFMVGLSIGSAIALIFLIKIDYLDMAYGWAFVPGFVLMSIVCFMFRVTMAAGKRRWE